MLGGISIWQLLIVLLIIILLFGTKKLKTIGGDLGTAFKGFKKAMNEKDEDADFEDVKQVARKHDEPVTPVKEGQPAGSERKE